MAIVIVRHLFKHLFVGGARKTTLVSDVDLTCPCDLKENSCDTGCCCDQVLQKTVYVIMHWSIYLKNPVNRKHWNDKTVSTTKLNPASYLKRKSALCVAIKQVSGLKVCLTYRQLLPSGLLESNGTLYFCCLLGLYWLRKRELHVYPRILWRRHVWEAFRI